MIDAAIGYTLVEVAERAVDKAIEAIEAQLQPDKEVDIRLFVSGFSRGGATARHFMNVFEQRWRERDRGSRIPRLYALVFDTVATGQRENLLLQVPVTTDLFYHFVSMAERRLLFSPIIDIERGPLGGRILTVAIPGAHSDVGASYVGGVGSEYLANIDALLASMGLIAQQCFSVNGDARAQGKNDSRWLIDLLRGVGAPDTSGDPGAREVFLVRAATVPDNFPSGWEARMMALEFNGQFSTPRCTSRRELWLPEFTITRHPEGFKVVSLPPINLPSARIQTDDGSYFLTYTFDGARYSRIEIPMSVLDRVSVKGRATLSLSIVEDDDGGYRFWWFLDGERVDRPL